MSVPAWKRSKSGAEFFVYANELYDALTILLIRDFGIKTISRDLKAFAHSAKMTKEDKEIFGDLCGKYHIDLEVSYPLWLIDYYREKMLEILGKFIDNIVQTNTIYPNSYYEFDLRRGYQQQAIGNCYQLLHTLQAVIRIFPVKAEKLMPFVDMILHEIDLLKSWKKSGNKIKKAIAERLAENPPNFPDYYYAKGEIAPPIDIKNPADKYKNKKKNTEEKKSDNKIESKPQNNFLNNSNIKEDVIITLVPSEEEKAIIRPFVIEHISFDPSLIKHN